MLDAWLNMEPENRETWEVKFVKKDLGLTSNVYMGVIQKVCSSLERYPFIHWIHFLGPAKAGRASKT